MIDSHSVITAFHERGINLRFMGVVANKSQMVHVKTILKLEMVTKVLKNIFYTEVEASNPNIKEILTDYLNLIFSPTEDSRVFFTSMVYPKINEYFEFSINEFPLPGARRRTIACYHVPLRGGYLCDRLRLLPEAIEAALHQHRSERIHCQRDGIPLRGVRTQKGG